MGTVLESPKPKIQFLIDVITGQYILYNQEIMLFMHSGVASYELPKKKKKTMKDKFQN